MPVGMQIDGISFTELSLTNRSEHAATLGRIFTSWSLIEASIAALLGLMMHDDYRAALALLRSFRTNSARIAAVRNVGKEVLEPALLKDFDDVMKEVLAFAEERNAIAHGVWGSRESEPEIIYRMSIEDYSRFLIETIHVPVEKILGKIDPFKASFTTFTLDELKRIEQRGQDVLLRAMTETSKKAHGRAVENLAKVRA